MTGQAKGVRAAVLTAAQKLGIRRVRRAEEDNS
jgi:hypothetical protein